MLAFLRQRARGGAHRRWSGGAVKALKHFAEKAPITIFPDELIVGRPNTWLGPWGIVHPELDGAIMPARVEMFRKNKGKTGEVTVTDDDAKSARG